jgi:hypothetical protein
MVSDSNGSGFDHFCGSPLVEPARWCGGANLDYRLVRSDNGRSGDHFWLSLAQLGDTGNPLISGERLQSHHSNRGLFLRAAEALSSASQTFYATKPIGGGFIKKNAAWSD